MIYSRDDLVITTALVGDNADGDWNRCGTEIPMKLAGFEVQMFKCVMDSGWITVTPLTVIVGKNESGKTAMLKALHKFNPFKPESYVPREWPRGHRDKQSTHQIVCTAEFELSTEEETEVLNLTNTPAPLRTLRLTKDYSGKSEVLFPVEVFPNKLHPNEIDAGCDSLPVPSEPVGAPFQVEADACKSEAVRLAHEGRFSELAAAPELHRARRRRPLAPPISSRSIRTKTPMSNSTRQLSPR